MKLNLNLFGSGADVVFQRKNKKNGVFTGDLGFDNTKLAEAKLKFKDKDDEIKTLFATFKTSLDTAVGKGAFLGAGQVNALQKYVDDMSDAMMNFLAQFETFGAKLDTASEKYKTQVSTQATSFTNTEREVGTAAGGEGK